MKYIIIGAGGTGGILGFYMTKAGKDVTLIARNAHLESHEETGNFLSKKCGQTKQKPYLSVQKVWNLMRQKEKKQM